MTRTAKEQVLSVDSQAKFQAWGWKAGEVVHSTEVPAYTLWNYYAHATDCIDAHLDEVAA